MARRITCQRIKGKKKCKFLRQTIYIGIEDSKTNKTEKNYLNSIMQKERINIKVVRSHYTDPVNIVNAVVKQGINNNDSFGFCIIDGDLDKSKNIQIKEALRIATANNIKIILSTPCIEYWFLLHYCYTTASVTNKEVISHLKRYFPSYDKNIDDFEEINAKLCVAIKNAKMVEQEHLKGNNNLYDITTNPYTMVYQLFEFIEGKK